MKKLVQRANKQLRVDESQIESFRQRGFALIDEKTGKVLGEAKQSNPKKELEALRKANAELLQANAALETANAELTAKLEAKQE